jgi:hypothetical protein
MPSEGSKGKKMRNFFNDSEQNFSNFEDFSCLTDGGTSNTKSLIIFQRFLKPIRRGAGFRHVFA